MEKFYIDVTKEAYEEDFNGFLVKGIDANVLDLSGNTIDKNVFVDCLKHCRNECKFFELSKRYKVEMEKEESHYVLCKFIGSMPEGEKKDVL